MKDCRTTPIIIEQQGSPKLLQDVAFVQAEGDTIVALYLDLESKYCEIGASLSSSKGECGICIEATENSHHLDETKDREKMTRIYFPEFVGWDYWAGASGRYTIQVCLIKHTA